MLTFIVRRLTTFIPMMFLMSVVAFALIQAPPGDFLSDYVVQLQNQGEYADPGELESLRKQYGLGEPMYIQYAKWVWGVMRWDFGKSLEMRVSVNDLINERLSLTIILGLFTVVFTWTLAIPIGIFSAVKQYSWVDYMFTFFSYLGVGTPNFLLALVIMWMVFAYFGMSITGLFSPDYVEAPWSVGKVVDMLKHIWVPMLILGTDGTARLTRIMRANLLDELNKPYVETARAKGLPEWQLIMRYPVRIAVNPIVSTIGWTLPQLFSGSLIVATVMSLPTLGPLLLRALYTQDMFLAGSIILILTALTLVGTLISDVVLALIDPRIRIGA
ncbi:MAG: ABC transporter permease [Dehalococcoidia bacterium]|nr:ABC transporter permease [Dehalococcoidia bacterium]